MSTPRKGFDWETRRSFVGWLNAVVGLLTAAVIMAVLANPSPIHTHKSVPVITIITSLGYPLLHVVGGIGFVFRRQWSRFVLWPISVLDLFGFPILTALGFYNIWVLYHTRARSKPVVPQAGGAGP